MEIKPLVRVFKYGNKELDDPNPNMTVQQVIKFYAGTYSELTNSNWSGPTIEDDKQVFEFKTSVGVKG